MPRNPVEKCNITFEDRYGSTTSGNLPTNKNECIESLLGDPTISGSNIWQIQQEFDWVTVNDFHFYHVKCPYSNESVVNYVKDTNPNSSTYWQMVEIVPASRGYHIITSGFMIRHSRGSKHGWMCVDPDCPYYQLNNINYFYT